MAEIVTPYTSQDLFLTKAFDDEFASQLVSRSPDGRQPFPRKIDLWWVAVIVGATIGHRTSLPPTEKLTKFNTGAILGREPWRVTNLELLALASEGEDIISKPSDVVRIGHEYAMTGLQWLADKLRGSSQPTLTLMTALEEFLAEQG
jgi:hypothetical protein